MKRKLMLILIICITFASCSTDTGNADAPNLIEQKEDLNVTREQVTTTPVPLPSSTQSEIKKEKEDFLSPAIEAFNNKDYREALRLFNNVDDYFAKEEYLCSIAIMYIEDHDFIRAYDIIEQISLHNDVSARSLVMNLKYAMYDDSIYKNDIRSRKTVGSKDRYYIEEFLSILYTEWHDHATGDVYEITESMIFGRSYYVLAVYESKSGYPHLYFSYIDEPERVYFMEVNGEVIDLGEAEMGIYYISDGSLNSSNPELNTWGDVTLCNINEMEYQKYMDKIKED